MATHKCTRSNKDRREGMFCDSKKCELCISWKELTKAQREEMKQFRQDLLDRTILKEKVKEIKGFVKWAEEYLVRNKE